MSSLESITRDLDERGYAVVKDVLEPEGDLSPLLDEYGDVLDNVAATLYQQGRISEPYATLPFAPRLIELTKQAGRSLSQHFDISLPQAGIRGGTPIHVGPAAFNVLTNPRLLDIAETIVGPDIYVSPVGHVRMKLPEGTLASGGDGMMAKIPWHQDNGVVLEEADSANVLTVWIAITDATIDNGCMQVVPQERGSDLRTHCPSTSKGAHIPDRDVEEGEAVQLPMRSGSVLLMHPRTIHSSLENQTSDQVRISMDLRYQPVGQPTGRPQFPGFVARSRTHPETELRDPQEWAQMWHDARTRLHADQPTPFNRWDADSPVCA